MFCPGGEAECPKPGRMGMLRAQMAGYGMRKALNLLQEPREVLVHQELHVAPDEALPAAHGGALRL